MELNNVIIAYYIVEVSGLFKYLKAFLEIGIQWNGKHQLNLVKQAIILLYWYAFSFDLLLASKWLFVAGSVREKSFFFSAGTQRNS